jgi:acetylornithine deacetylase/succinyl-diaminopimelate desuccinylase-like protein
LLLYAHHDVQPSGPEDLWDTPPFEPVERGGRIFGRGAADDKSGVVLHAAALRAFDGAPPVQVKVVVEGEEEAISGYLPQLVAEHRELFAADVVVVADSGNWKTGEPTLTITLRGVVDCTVEVRTLEVPVHSGSYGGAAPDALVALIRVLSTLHDQRGNCAIAGLTTMSWDGLDYPEQDFRREAGLLAGVRLVGDGSVGERTWCRPSVSVIGIDGPPVHGARNILVDRARAKVSLRIPPNEDPERARGLLAAHLESAVPWGAQVTVTKGDAALGYATSTSGPAYSAARRAMEAAYGKPTVDMGAGGSIPLVPVLAGAFPEAEMLLMGAMDDRANAHAQNESVDLAEIERSALAEALLFRELSED